MIVGSYFEGDHGAASWQQHDCYDAALRVIVSGCQNHLHAARQMLDTTEDIELPFDFDHRVLQLAHDLLAAVWRFRADPAQLELFALQVDEGKTSWLVWLEEEVDCWWREPSLIRYVRNSLRYQNTVKGYVAEGTVAWRLLRLYADVPWSKTWRDAIRSDYERSLACSELRRGEAAS